MGPSTERFFKIYNFPESQQVNRPLDSKLLCLGCFFVCLFEFWFVVFGGVCWVVFFSLGVFFDGLFFWFLFF